MSYLAGAWIETAVIALTVVALIVWARRRLVTATACFYCAIARPPTAEEATRLQDVSFGLLRGYRPGGLARINRSARLIFKRDAPSKQGKKHANPRQMRRDPSRAD